VAGGALEPNQAGLGVSGGLGAAASPPRRQRRAGARDPGKIRGSSLRGSHGHGDGDHLLARFCELS